MMVRYNIAANSSLLYYLYMVFVYSILFPPHCGYHSTNAEPACKTIHICNKSRPGNKLIENVFLDRKGPENKLNEL